MKKKRTDTQMSASVPCENTAERKPLIKCGDLPLSNCAGAPRSGTVPVGSRDAMERGGVFGTANRSFAYKAAKGRSRNKPRAT